MIYKKSQHPYSIGRNLLFAPDVAKGKDGRYYLYYSVADSAIMSVAVCDKPAGQYVYYGDVHDREGHVAGSAKGDFYQFDPGIFVDDDGRIYLFSGFCPGKREDELGRRYFEAPSMRKYNGKYYLIYSVRIGGLHYYISDRPDGSIRQAEATSCGLNGGPLAGIGKYPAYIACALMDKNDSRTADGKKMTASCITQEGQDRECGPGQFVSNIINK